MVPSDQPAGSKPEEAAAGSEEPEEAAADFEELEEAAADFAEVLKTVLPVPTMLARRGDCSNKNPVRSLQNGCTMMSEREQPSTKGASACGDVYIYICIYV